MKKSLFDHNDREAAANLPYMETDETLGNANREGDSGFVGKNMGGGELAG